MDGKTSYEDRAKILKTFDRDPTIRVSFFSSVGAVGVNLSRASVVIFLVFFVKGLQDKAIPDQRS